MVLRVEVLLLARDVDARVQVHQELLVRELLVPPEVGAQSQSALSDYSVASITHFLTLYGANKTLFLTPYSVKNVLLTLVT